MTEESSFIYIDDWTRFRFRLVVFKEANRNRHHLLTCELSCVVIKLLASRYETHVTLSQFTVPDINEKSLLLVRPSSAIVSATSLPGNLYTSR